MHSQFYLADLDFLDSKKLTTIELANIKTLGNIIKVKTINKFGIINFLVWLIIFFQK